MDDPVSPPAGQAVDATCARTIAVRLGFDVPAPCLPGVRDNAALLSRHWETLASFVVPEA